MTHHEFYTCDYCGEHFESKAEAHCHEKGCRRNAWNREYARQKADMGKIFLVMWDDAMVEFDADIELTEIYQFYIPSPKAYDFFLKYWTEKGGYGLPVDGSDDEVMGWYDEGDNGWRNINQEVRRLSDWIIELYDMKNAKEREESGV